MTRLMKDFKTGHAKIKRRIYVLKILHSESTLGAVHNMPEEFENAALFLRLGPPSTLIRHENGAFQKRS